MVKSVVSSRITFVFLSVAISTGCVAKARTIDAPTTPPHLMSPQELQALPSQAADFRIAYGSDSSQFGELRVPPGAGPHPVAVLIHGGCFKAMYATLKDLAPMADALKEDGIATWNIEYRRLGQPGGGWPGTYLDVSRAVDHLRNIASEHQLDLNRVVIVGHSAGGHLAMWAAARAHVPANSAIHTDNPLPIRGVINLAGPIDMTANIQGYEGHCRDTVITSLMGGSPQAVPEHYSSASINKLVPLGIPQVVVIGEFEEFLPRPIAESYVRTARQAGDQARLTVIPGVGHFELASPRASPWQQVAFAVRALFEGKLPQ
ncbi:MAG TPA: alpha/beta hydrolase [Gemmatimonadaceae bacterium]|nr:alpha/beta hydrolase [Gemmatimonadaceae bacterium]